MQYSTNEDCVEGKCEECCESEFLYDVITTLQSTDEVVYYKWVSGPKFPEKIMKVGTGSEAAEELKEQTQSFKRHNYSRIRQHTELAYLKDSIIGTKTAIIQVDFSENYQNTQRNEIQSAYFGHNNFSLYTMCVWYAEGQEIKSKTFCLISNSLMHDKFHALHYNKLIIQEMRQIVDGLQKVHFRSDGCAGQFKSKYCFYLLSLYPSDLEITWNYFESHHNLWKGTCQRGRG